MLWLELPYSSTPYCTNGKPIFELESQERVKHFTNVNHFTMTILNYTSSQSLSAILSTS